MGVKHLWEIIGPTGRTVKLESLEHRRLAIDTSIWLNHFIKAMRDKKGNMISNAHIKGLFSRVCKLLYFGVRPVFVFDGATPLLKKNTTARRQRAKETSSKKVQQLAEKILLNQLQLQSLKELKKSIADGDKETAKQLLEKLTTVNAGGLKAIGDDDIINIDDDDDIEEDRIDQEGAIPLSEFVDQGEFDGLFGSEDEADGAVLVEDSDDDSEGVPDFLPSAASVSATLTDQQLKDLNIDSESFQQLPDDIKRDVLAQLQQLQAHHRRSRVRQMLREGDLDARPDPNAFSDLQLANLIQRSRVTRKIQELTQTLSGNAERPIASSSTGRYILRKDGGSESSTALQRPDGSLVRLRSDGTLERVSGSSQIEELRVEPRNVVLQDPTRSGAFSTTPKKNERNLDSADDYQPARKNSNDAINIDDYEDDDEDLEAVLAEIEEEEFLEAQIAALEKSDSEDDIIEQNSVEYPTRKHKNADGDEVVYISTAATSAPSLDIVIDSNARGDDADEIDFEKFIDSAEIPLSSSSAPPVVRKGSSSIVIELDDDENGVESTQTAQKPAEVEIVPRVPERAEQPSSPMNIVFDDELDDGMIVGVDSDDAAEFADAEFDDQPPKRDVSPHPKTDNSTEKASESVPIALDESSNHSEPPQIHASSTAPSAAPIAASSIEHDVIVPESSNEPPLSPIEPSVGAPDASEAPAPHHVDQSLSQSHHMEVEHSSQPSVNDSISSVMIVAPQTEVGPSELIGVSVDALNRSIQSNNEDIWPEQVENMERELQAEVGRMQSERRARAGQAQGVTDEMIEDCKELLQLFGVPYVESPGEADAQCAILEKYGLVDGIVSDDSDIFLFGGNNVFRHAFDRRYHLELYSMKDVEDALELKQEDLINCALLLGSDYTDGIRGIGAVSAKDIVTHFRGADGLKRFRDWIVNGIEHGLDEKSRRWFAKHKSLRQKIKSLDQHFPSHEVIDAYLHPLIDNSREEFEWNCPDLDRLREFCSKRFGWEVEQTDLRVVPIVQRYNKTLTTVQRRIETFFLPLMKKDKGGKTQKRAVPASNAASSSAIGDVGGKNDDMEFGFFEDDEYLRIAEELEDSPKSAKSKSRAAGAKRKRSKTNKNDSNNPEESEQLQAKRTPPKRKTKKSKTKIVVSDDDDDDAVDSDGFEPSKSDEDDDLVLSNDDGEEQPPSTRRPRKMPKRS